MAAVAVVRLASDATYLCLTWEMSGWQMWQPKPYLASGRQQSILEVVAVDSRIVIYSHKCFRLKLFAQTVLEISRWFSKHTNKQIYQQASSGCTRQSIELLSEKLSDSLCALKTFASWKLLGKSIDKHKLFKLLSKLENELFARAHRKASRIKVLWAFSAPLPRAMANGSERDSERTGEALFNELV